MNDEYLIYGDTLRAIGDAIRNVANISTTATPIKMAQYIQENLVKPTTRQAAKTYTPSTSNQTIAKGTFLTGAATITGEPNYVEGNIRKGTKMWGKTGTLDGIFGTPGSLYSFTTVKSGTFTLANYTSDYSVSHGLGTTPKLLICYANGDPCTNTNQSRTFVGGLFFQTSTDTKISANATTTNGEFMCCYKTRSIDQSNYEYQYSHYATTTTASRYTTDTLLSNTTSMNSSYYLPLIANTSKITINAAGSTSGSTTYKWLAAA